MGGDVGCEYHARTLDRKIDAALEHAVAMCAIVWRGTRAGLHDPFVHGAERRRVDVLLFARDQDLGVDLCRGSAGARAGYRFLDDGHNLLCKLGFSLLLDLCASDLL